MGAARLSYSKRALLLLVLLVLVYHWPQASCKTTCTVIVAVIPMCDSSHR
jgi:hypothetical protein